MNLARFSDVGVGTCFCHKFPIPMTGRIVTMAKTVECNGRKVAILFSVVQGACGHSGRMIRSSSTVTAEGLGVVRLLDGFQGCFVGNIVTASNNTTAG